METIDALAVALGLATLSGINLYLTVLVAGLAIRFGWVTLAEAHGGLAILSDPWVIGIAATLYLLEFFADKVPWVDSFNDAIHTAIRPIGGAILGVLSLGDANPAVSVVAALLCGGAALTTHAAKAGTRLVVNASPEPLSNVGLSLGEDVAVVGGMTLLALNPLLMAGLALLVLVAAWLVLPGLLRATRATLWLAWRKLNSPPPDSPAPSTHLPSKCLDALRRATSGSSPVGDAAPCVSGGGPRLPKHHIGWLTRLENGDLFFIAPRLLGVLLVKIPAATARRKSRFMAEFLEFSDPGLGPYRFHFDRSSGAAADRFAAPTRPTEARTPEPAAA